MIRGRGFREGRRGCCQKPPSSLAPFLPRGGGGDNGEGALLGHLQAGCCRVGSGPHMGRRQGRSQASVTCSGWRLLWGSPPPSGMAGCLGFGPRTWPCGEHRLVPASGAPGTQDSTCLGLVGGRPPFPRNSHWGRSQSLDLVFAFTVWVSGRTPGLACSEGRTCLLSPSLHLPRVSQESCPLTPTLSPRGTCPDFVLTVSEEAWM